MLVKLTKYNAHLPSLEVGTSKCRPENMPPNIDSGSVRRVVFDVENFVPPTFRTTNFSSVWLFAPSTRCLFCDSEEPLSLLLPCTFMTLEIISKKYNMKRKQDDGFRKAKSK